MVLKDIRLAAALSIACASAALGQGNTLSFQIDDTDPAYSRNPGYTYEVTTVFVADPSNFRADASNISVTGTGAPGSVGYALFPVGVPVPTALNFRDHRDGPATVAASIEGSAQTRSGVLLRDRAGGPLTAGPYQLVIAPADANGRRGDFLLDLTVSGGSFVALAVQPNSTFRGATAGMARLVTVDATGVARDVGQTSLATRAEQLSFARSSGEDGAPMVTMSSMNQPGMMGALYGWAEITGFHASDDASDRSLRGYGLQIGADMALSPNMVLGLSIGASNTDTDVAGTLIDGTLIYLQPYLAYREGPWSAEATFLYGRGDFEQTGVGGDGTGETELYAVTANGAYDVALSPGFVLSPTLGLVYGREEVTGTGGVVTGMSEVDFYQVSAGARLTRSFDGGELFGGLHVDYQEVDSDTVLTGDIILNDGATGRIELGGSWALGRGLGLDTSLEIGGIGGDLTETSGALRVNFTF